MDDLISRQAAIDSVRAGVLSTAMLYGRTEEGETARKEIERTIKALPSFSTEKTKWIPVSERVADFPCLACDIYEQIFIPFGVVTINNRCFDGKDFEFDVEKFLKGKEVTLFSGEKVYELPREIVAWMPLPQPYKGESEE